VHKKQKKVVVKGGSSGEDQSDQEGEELELNEMETAQNKSFVERQDQLLTSSLPLDDMMDVLKDMAEHSDVIEGLENFQGFLEHEAKDSFHMHTLKSLGQWIAMSLLAFLTIWVLFLTPLPNMVVDWTIFSLRHANMHVQSWVNISEELMNKEKNDFNPCV
jgi:hypothetical protein